MVTKKAAAAKTALPEAAKAAAGPVSEEAAVRLEPVEKWAEEKGTDRAVLAGIKAMRHWGNGKNIPEKVYDEAVAAFKKGAAAGRKK